MSKKNYKKSKWGIGASLYKDLLNLSGLVKAPVWGTPVEYIPLPFWTLYVHAFMDSVYNLVVFFSYVYFRQDCLASILRSNT